EAAHDSGKGNGLVCVGDDQIFGRKVAIYSVEGFKSLALPRTADNNLAALQEIKIESVCGMAHFPQRVVRSVGSVIDRALIDEGKPAGNFLRRRLDFDPANDLCGVACATFAIIDLDCER